MLSIKNLFYELNGHTLLEDISVTIGKHNVIGLIGPNGCGKSTLFNLILKRIKSESGTISLQNERIGFVPQEFDFGDVKTFGEWKTSTIPDPKKQFRLEAILSRLSLNPHPNNTQELGTLSEGQKLKLKLAEALAHEPTLLLMDEPTNHLDIEGILWLETFINTLDASILMISHDRRFLDKCVNRIFEIDEKKLHVFEGNYSNYREQKVSWVEKRNLQYKMQEKKRAQLETLIESARGIKDGKQRGKALRAARKRRDREVSKNEISAYDQYGIKGLNVEGNTHSSKLMLRLDNVSKTFGKKTVFNDLTFEMRGKERVWLYGPNGAGKSTLVNIITNTITPTTGIVTMGENVTWGYFKQNQEHLPLNDTAYEYIRKFMIMTDHQARSFLGKLSFSGEYLDRKLRDMSPGERARLSFGLFTTKEYDLLILDEPTNHLDVWTKETIEKSLATYDGSLLLISHDRMFVQNVGVQKILNLKEGKLQLT
ncbi:hypothetical protein COX05_01435 [candidate division WWE3 bacterium CG22_combo_CG10-13_8_21_14_all_39_12]|uniref:ABC transporter domain-containing protein n=2 Tax=Katanobacteria TaxID=422282 RepID=A0A2M7X452_UNCKA|nr:MAG: hypothetical protein COX05_01435 [candidate division WWE3 bacterium CG22_combo_CG10-13_8_21_14_all_39_12]PJA40928.1 MAG: hypothetical protein CO179_00980 [candidate division WWE3 bacterium CG_4_9_14_3_um_filter_39_7]